MGARGVLLHRDVGNSSGGNAVGSTSRVVAAPGAGAPRARRPSLQGKAVGGRENNNPARDERGSEPETGAVRLLPPPSAPLAVARAFVADQYTLHGVPTLLHWRGQWWRWQLTRWAEAEERAVRGAAYLFTEHALCLSGGSLDSWAPTRSKISNLLDAVAALCYLPASVEQPTWIGGADDRGDRIVSCTNGLLNVVHRKLLPHDPRFFTATSVAFDYAPGAAAPTRWLGFLDALWGSDGEQTAALQEWFGYTIAGRTDMHAILLLVGPTRAGKGVICRVLSKLVGRACVAGPTLSSLRGEFGLAPLIGRSLAVISDARLNGQDQSVVVERLLSISGEDTLTVNIKYRPQWTGKLPSRLMICSNELPRLSDASGAIAGRFLTLQLERSWLGKEDYGLESALDEEMGGILAWALGGLERLERQGRFTRPKSTEAALAQLQDLASPISAFIRDCCVIGAECEVPVNQLWTAWCAWADDSGHSRTNKQILGRNLKAALPQIKVRRPRDGDMRDRVYTGVALRSPL